MGRLYHGRVGWIKGFAGIVGSCTNREFYFPDDAKNRFFIKQLPKSLSVSRLFLFREGQHDH